LKASGDGILKIGRKAKLSTTTLICTDRHGGHFGRGAVSTAPAIDAARKSCAGVIAR
jgi:hypothetical protein